MAARDGLIALHVTDGGSGVRYDGGTVTISVEGDLIYDGAHETSAGECDTRSSSRAVKGICRRAGTAADYAFTFTPTTRFDYDQKVDVVLTVADVEGNTGTVSYSFTTEARSFGENAKVNSDTAKVNHDHPHTAADSAGNIWVVWDQQTASGDTDIYIGKLAAGGAAFGTSAAIYQGAGAQSQPVVAIDRNNQLHVAWQARAANGNWDVCVPRSSDGVMWSTAAVVNVGDPNNTSNQVRPSIAYDGLNPGTVYVAYEDDRAGNKDIWIATSTDAITWSETPITNDPADQTQPYVSVSSEDKSACVVWTDARTDWAHPTNIFGARSNNSWTNIAVVAEPSVNSHPVCAAYTNALLLWVSDDGSLANVHFGVVQNGIGSAYITGTTIADETGVGQAAPSLAMNASQTAFAAWQDSRNVKDSGDTDIYFAKRSFPDEMTSSTFGTNVLVNDDTGKNAQSAPAVGADLKGNPYVVWVDERNGNKDIYYAGAVSIGDPIPTTVTTNGTRITVQAAAQANLQVEIPEMPSQVRADQITISEVSNPPQMPASMNEVGLKYEFGPTGLQFPEPNHATIRIPLPQDPGYETYRIYRYDPTNPLVPWTESGVHNPATKVTGANGTYLEVHVDHFSIYGAAGITAGGGGGCALSPCSACRPLEFLLPFVGYALILFCMTLADRLRRSK